MLKTVIKNTNEYINCVKREDRKNIGQFFTCESTARYMASLFDFSVLNTTVKILDPGAGSGILSAAVLERLEKSEKVKNIELTCFETDDKILTLLKNNLNFCKEKSKKNVKINIIAENYITTQYLEFNNNLCAEQNPKKFDYIISNPPYIKLDKKAIEALSMPSICYGAPNLYFLFAAMSLFNLKDNAEMVYIMPRSWTSGAYFYKFREYLLNNGCLEHIHLFLSRDKVFETEKVLQETMVIKIKKTRIKNDSITITTSKGNNFDECTYIDVKYDDIVTGKNKYVYLITSDKEVEVIEKINQFKYTLPEIGLKMKTGLTVDFRNKQLLCDVPKNNTVPLFYSQHIKNGKIIFPLKKKGEYITTDKSSLLQINKNYLFIKRFTAKEEKRRLQCGIYLSKEFSQYKEISTQNKINFIESDKQLSEEIVFGLYVIFNSYLYDSYYRILNGSTQVNSTEFNTIPVPSLEIIEKMGIDLLKNGNFDEETCDNILLKYLEENKMSKLEEARDIIQLLGVPQRQQADLCCYVLLAMAGLNEAATWNSAKNDWIRIHDIITFIKDNYGIAYAENSRETFRKQAIHHFRNAAFIEDNGKATNSPNYRYRLTNEMLHLIKTYKTNNWKKQLKMFLDNHNTLISIYASKKKMQKMPVKINGVNFTFSTGSHNQLQKSILEEFAPRFAPDSECLYVGDTIEKDLVKNVDKLHELGFTITLHDKMPDVVLYSKDKNWLYFIEAVTSVGPMEPKRIKELEEMTIGVTAGKIYVTAFLDFKTFKKFSETLAWETEVWIAEIPDHMIHLNGDKFLGPRR